MKHLRTAAVGLVAASLSILSPSFAQADPTSATQPGPGPVPAGTTTVDADGVKVVETSFAPVASITPLTASKTCQYGSYKGQVSASLSNGTITTSFCRYDNGRISQVNTNYYKSGGSAVTLRNIWEWTNSSGSTYKERKWDTGAFTAVSGNNYPFTWRYAYPGLSAPQMTPCTRGGVYDTNLSYPYTTRVLC